MESRPRAGKYKGLWSTVVIAIVGAFILIASILTLISGFITKNSILGTNYIVISISGIVIAALLSVVSAIAEDIHYQKYLNEYNADENEWFNTQALQKLHSIEGMLMQQCYPQQMPYMPQQTPQPEPVTYEAQPKERVHYPEKDPEKQENEQQEEAEAEYKAQFMRPTVQTRKALSPKQKK